MGLSTIPLLLTIISSAVVDCRVQTDDPMPAAMENFVHTSSMSGILISIVAAGQQTDCAWQRHMEMRRLLLPLQPATQPIVLF